jgi:hypothetical protein
MNFTSKGTREILVAGCQNRMFKVDVEKGAIIETVSVGTSTSLPSMLTPHSFQPKLNIPS